MYCKSEFVSVPGDASRRIGGATTPGVQQSITMGVTGHGDSSEVRSARMEEAVEILLHAQAHDQSHFEKLFVALRQRP